MISFLERVLTKLRAVFNAVVNPLTLSVGIFLSLFVLSNLYILVPDGDVDELVAALRVNTIGMLISIVFLLAYILFIHPARTINEAVAKIVMAILLMLQIWEVAMNVTCKVAANPIASEALWGIDGAKALCSRTIGPGAQITQIIIGFSLIGYVLWRLRRTLKTSKP